MSVETLFHLSGSAALLDLHQLESCALQLNVFAKRNSLIPAPHCLLLIPLTADKCEICASFL